MKSANWNSRAVSAPRVRPSICADGMMLQDRSISNFQAKEGVCCTHPEKCVVIDPPDSAPVRRWPGIYHAVNSGVFSSNGGCFASRSGSDAVAGDPSPLHQQFSRGQGLSDSAVRIRAQRPVPQQRDRNSYSNCSITISGFDPSRNGGPHVPAPLDVKTCIFPIRLKPYTN